MVGATRRTAAGRHGLRLLPLACPFEGPDRAPGLFNVPSFARSRTAAPAPHPVALSHSRPSPPRLLQPSSLAGSRPRQRPQPCLGAKRRARPHQHPFTSTTPDGVSRRLDCCARNTISCIKTAALAGRVTLERAAIRGPAQPGQPTRHPIGLSELADDLLRGVARPAVHQDDTSLPARRFGQQDDSHNSWTQKIGVRPDSRRPRISLIVVLIDVGTRVRFAAWLRRCFVTNHCLLLWLSRATNANVPLAEPSGDLANPITLGATSNRAPRGHATQLASFETNLPDFDLFSEPMIPLRLGDDLTAAHLLAHRR